MGTTGYKQLKTPTLHLSISGFFSHTKPRWPQLKDQVGLRWNQSGNPLKPK